ncbi:TPA: SDR family oxidoreductase [Candidatus Poribacteria bacterium]|jgi:NAD(P)-dependent dehydrogenase (short-subunit alcohol dehydrogenase family)|nr:SDR family oxidoreductase [Candidatus Poribacteria bacterium]HIA69150.1 SDR family oxidoreductase [Candidatus Poribacteria bacterium]HIC00821.1 SDR family oxidoreductase [Candidatus Poribacteria bacterium]HIM11616.1 SDR family oxidoreductase [Candidatus Poribacteria bacterium]HIO79768.1 SDR family oxidoreductase [Candidatus Poribacteria bacterium]
MQLKDKVIIVTGGGRGIGEAIAVGYAQEGAKVVVAARSIGQLDQVVEKIQSQGGQAISVPTDARFLPQVENLVQQTVDQFGKIDVLVNNAGINPRGLFLDSTEEEWEQSWQINVVGVVHCCRTVLPVMKAQGRGNIINIGSGMGQVGRGNLSVYCASKFALHGLSQAIAEEVWEDGIIVNVLIPGPVKTELSRPMWEGAGEVRASSDPWKDPEQVVPSAVFLAAQPPSSGMTGQILSIMRRNSP